MPFGPLAYMASYYEEVLRKYTIYVMQRIVRQKVTSPCPRVGGTCPNYWGPSHVPAGCAADPSWRKFDRLDVQRSSDRMSASKPHVHAQNDCQNSLILCKF